MKFREGVVPPDGFYYIQPTDAGDITVRGATLGDLSSNLLNLRSRLGIELGDPALDAEVFTCSRAPHLCNDFDITLPQVANESREAQPDPTKRLTAWRSNRYSQSVVSGGGELARQDIAEARAQICANCPAKISKPREGCVPCIQENDRVLFVLRQGRSVQVQAGLCSITGQDNETASFFQGETLSYANKYQEEIRDKIANGEASASCWLLPENGPES